VVADGDERHVRGQLSFHHMGKHDQPNAPKEAEIVTSAPPEPTPPPPTPPEDEPKKPTPPAGMSAFKALLSKPVAKGDPPMRSIQAAMLAVFATEQPELMIEAMDDDEVRLWAVRYRTSNPRAWHAAMTGNVIQFAQYTNQVPSETIARYQQRTSELMSVAFSFRPTG
jgi:hypothetical protein